MPDALTAYLDGKRVGVFSRDGADHRFEVDGEWAETSGRLEVSMSLEKSRPVHSGTAVLAYLQGLLPDNAAVLSRWSRAFHTSTQPMDLLSHVGLDCAGAIQFSLGTDETLVEEGGLDDLTDDDIERHIRTLRASPAEWELPSEHSGYFSLAGAQSKFALRKLESGWAAPWGSEPSTHIVKPGIIGLPEQDVVEHVTMRVAAVLGLRVAMSSVERFGSETAIVVERYDRLRAADGTVLRMHQEDFCQALAVPPDEKYESDGGPGLGECVGLLESSLRGSARRAAVDEFFDAILFNWLVAGTDAHAKNYSLLHTHDGPAFAPLYDMASSLPYTDRPGWHERKLSMAMRIDRRYRLFEIDGRHIARQAQDLGLDPLKALGRLAELADALPDAVVGVTRDLDGLGLDADFLGHVTEVFLARARSVATRLATTTQE